MQLSKLTFLNSTVVSVPVAVTQPPFVARPFLMSTPSTMSEAPSLRARIWDPSVASPPLQPPLSEYWPPSLDVIVMGTPPDLAIGLLSAMVMSLASCTVVVVEGAAACCRPA